MKYFFFVQTFHSENINKASFDENKDINSRECFASVEAEKVKCFRHLLEDQDFWFCQWIAKSENQIHEKLKAGLSDKLLLAMPQEMKIYASAIELGKKVYSGNLSTSTSKSFS